MGTWPQSIPGIGQTALEVTATRTTYRFEEAGIRLEVVFLSPLLPFELDVMARPISYVTATITATDRASHEVQLLFGVSPVLATDTPTQEVLWSRSRLRGMTVLRASNFRQPVLEKAGDNLRIDWGSVLLAVPDQSGA
ncbi:MAG: glutaminase, partial [Acidobacteria bacterium]